MAVAAHEDKLPQCMQTLILEAENYIRRNVDQYYPAESCGNVGPAWRLLVPKFQAMFLPQSKKHSLGG